MHKIPIGVIGASGYAGRELCALVMRHPALELAFATANERRGHTINVCGRDVTFIASDDAPLARARLVFSALPHGMSAPWVNRAGEAGCRAVDLSADLRPGSPDANDTPYGLTELMRRVITGAPVVANPGCYPTAILVALAPLVRRGLVAPGSSINIVAASGVTGAGFTPKPELMFAEVAGDYRAYGIGNSHRHLAEMRSMISAWGADVDLIFTPHLLPVPRGILATITVRLVEGLPDAMAPWREDYNGEPFIELAHAPPSLREVVGRNAIRIHAAPVAGMRDPTLLVIAALDNLVKGAAGQAIQNANVMLGLTETAGLPA